MRSSATREVIKIALGSIGFGAVIAAIFAARGDDFLISWPISTLYSLSIGIPAKLAIHRLRPRVLDKPELVQWLAFLAAVLGCSAVGTLFVGLVLVAVGLAPLAELWAVYVNGFKIAFAITIPVTAGAVSLSRLRTRLAEREAALRASAVEARLASLESRIRPHFLFNALNSAIALIPDQPARAEQVLERLAALLRFSLDAHHSRVVTLGEELRVVRDYLEIERARFGERLRYELDVDDALSAVAIPAFAVQTLVENSVKYAVTPRTAGATIRVRARRSGERLALEVADDGPGFSGAVWLAGHGLDGLRARLLALYGDAASVTAPAPVAAGAAVQIELPIAAAREAA